MFTRENKLPRAYEVLDSVLVRGDAKELARRLSCSPQLINSWCREPESEAEYATGKRSFLDRARETIAMVKEDDGSPERAYPLGDYIASLLGGTFVPDFNSSCDADSDILKCIGDVLKQTGITIEDARKYWFEESPGRFTPKEKAQLDSVINNAVVALLQLRQFVRGR